MKSENLLKLSIFIILTIVIVVSFYENTEKTDGMAQRYDFIPEDVLFIHSIQIFILIQVMKI